VGFGVVVYSSGFIRALVDVALLPAPASDLAYLVYAHLLPRGAY
jgi:hypothetical protein